MEVGTQFCLICRMSGKYHFENRTTARLTDGLECVENSLCSISLIIVVVFLVSILICRGMEILFFFYSPGFPYLVSAIKHYFFNGEGFTPFTSKPPAAKRHNASAWWGTKIFKIWTSREDTFV